MFSSTMIASSITTPTASASASKVIVLIVNPNTHIAPKAATSESGIEVATTRVGRTRRRKPSTVRVASSAPSTSANWVSATDSRIADEKSITWSRCGKVRPSGMYLRSSSTWSWVRFAMSTVFASDCFRMPMPAPGAPLKRARKRSSSAPSSTRATSPSRTVAPATSATIRLARSSIDLNSASVFSEYSSAWLSSRPAGTSMCSRCSALTTSSTPSPRARSASPSIQIRIARSRLPKISVPATPEIVSR